MLKICKLNISSTIDFDISATFVSRDFLIVTGNVVEQLF